MNEALKNIQTRRSVRKYTGQAVPEEQIQLLLDAAMTAPSACRKDPWEFVLLRSETVRRQVAGCLPNGPFLADAALGIMVCGDLKRAHAESLSYLLQDCAAAIENILLAAHALGLGGCWLGIHPREERIAALNGIFNFPPDIIPVGMIALGVPAEHPEPRSRFNSARVHNAEDWLK